LIERAKPPTTKTRQSITGSEEIEGYLILTSLLP